VISRVFGEYLIQVSVGHDRKLRISHFTAGLDFILGNAAGLRDPVSITGVRLALPAGRAATRMQR
jgi:hypothetical protein